MTAPPSGCSTEMTPVLGSTLVPGASSLTKATLTPSSGPGAGVHGPGVGSWFPPNASRNPRERAKAKHPEDRGAQALGVEPEEGTHCQRGSDTHYILRARARVA